MSVSKTNRWRLALLAVLCGKDLVVQLPSCCGIVDTKPTITVFLPGAIHHVRDEFGPLHLPSWSTNSLPSTARNVSSTQSRLQFAIFNYINDIHVTADDVTKGLICLCQRRTMQWFWA